MTFHGVQVFSLHACRSVCKVPATRKDCTLARFWSYLISCVIVAWKRAGSGTGFCPTCFPWQRFLWNSSGRTAHIASHNSTESKAFFFFFFWNAIEVAREKEYHWISLVALRSKAVLIRCDVTFIYVFIPVTTHSWAIKSVTNVAHIVYTESHLLLLITVLPGRLNQPYFTDK